MPRRVSLPGAAELFRPTEPARAESTGSGAGAPGPSRAGSGTPRGTGRVRHDEKITVYVSADELLALEEARLLLRARHGMAVDRGRIVREAVAGALADLRDRAEESDLVRRLSAS